MRYNALRIDDPQLVGKRIRGYGDSRQYNVFYRRSGLLWLFVLIVVLVFSPLLLLKHGCYRGSCRYGKLLRSLDVYIVRLKLFELIAVVVGCRYGKLRILNDCL